MKIAATIFGISLGIALLIIGTLLYINIYVSILIVCAGVAIITSSIYCLDRAISYRR
jgi:hypothetical protein